MQAGVDIRCGVHVTDLQAVQAQFPSAKYFVGADGEAEYCSAAAFRGHTLRRLWRYADCVANMKLSGKHDLWAG